MSPTPELVMRALERVLASPLFARADRQSRFLRHVVEKKLAGDDEALREMAIGLEVYGRPASYDPKVDPIVRVEAARLRGRLREYYETAEADDGIVIRLPKGSYAPTFEHRVALEPVAEPAPVAAVEHMAAAPVVQGSAPGRRWTMAAAAGFLLILVVG